MSTEHVNVNGHGHGHGNPANTKPSWYKQDVTEISPEAQWLLESYSKIQPDEVLPHVLAVVGHYHPYCSSTARGH